MRSTLVLLRARPRTSATRSPSARSPRRSGSRRSNARLRSERESRRRRVRLPSRASASRCRWSRSSRARSARSRPRSAPVPRRSSRRRRRLRWSCSSGPQPPGSARCACSRDAIRSSSLPSFPSSRRTSCCARQCYGYDPQRGELWFAGETAEAVLLELEARRTALAQEARTLSDQARLAERAAASADEQAEQAEAAFAAAAPRLRIRRAGAGTLKALLAAASRLERALDALDRAVDVVEAPLRARGEAGADRTAGLGATLRELGEAESVLRRELAASSEGAAAAERDLVRLGGTAGAVVAGGDVAELRAEAASLVAATDAAAAEASHLGEQARTAETARIDAAVRAGRRRARPHQLARVLAGAERLDATLTAAGEAAARFEAPLRARVDAGGTRTGGLGEELRRLGAAEVELRQALTNASAGVSAIEVEVARIEAEADEARRRLDHAGTDERAEGDDRKDLEESLAELEKLRTELTETVERRFAETFDAVQGNFEEVAATLFPGGEGRLSLADAEDEESQPGIEVELRPAGKRVQRLSLLSGGEKALGAISFLFALFLARPCPFYLLDEVEAALDDTNIGRFVALLRQYSDRAQFVVITHQKRTMEAADVLYGVTMGGDGISQIVSRRLPREEAEAVSAA